MRASHRVGKAACELRLLLLHRHQLPQGHGVGTCFAGTDSAQYLPSHEDLLCSARALPLGMAHQGTSCPEGAFLLSVRGLNHGHMRPQHPKCQGRSWRCVCVWAHVDVGVCDTVFLVLSVFPWPGVLLVSHQSYEGEGVGSLCLSYPQPVPREGQ